MVNKTISLSYWVDEKIKQEFNASGLIDSLLRQHYKYCEENKLEEAKLELEKKEAKERIEAIRKQCMEEEGDLWKNIKQK